jgi:hypothetical protein
MNKRICILLLLCMFLSQGLKCMLLFVDLEPLSELCTRAATFSHSHKRQALFGRLHANVFYCSISLQASLKQDTRAALAKHGLNYAKPSALQPKKGSIWPYEPADKAGRGRQALQKRQQRRQISLRG